MLHYLYISYLHQLYINDILITVHREIFTLLNFCEFCELRLSHKNFSCKKLCRQLVGVVIVGRGILLSYTGVYFSINWTLSYVTLRNWNFEMRIATSLATASSWIYCHVIRRGNPMIHIWHAFWIADTLSYKTVPNTKVMDESLTLYIKIS